MPINSPFGTDAVPRVPLVNPPLAKVIAQLRFPLVARLSQSDFIGPFQEALRSKYPILRQEQGVGLLIGPGGIVPQTEQAMVWRLLDKSGSWGISLATTFIALDTAAYTSREEFFERFAEALSALKDLVNPVVYDRLGVRYIDRLTGVVRLRHLPKYVRSELLGMIAVANRPDGPMLEHSVTETLYSIGSDRMLARCALLPPNAQMDPAVSPIPEPSWVLDIDMFTTKQADFDLESIATTGKAFALQSYRFFRWAVTDEFLREFGGTP